MMDDPIRFDLSDGMELAGVGVVDVWWRYAAFGGVADTALLSARISGTAECSDSEHDLIAQVLNEIFVDNGMETFPVGYRARYRPVPEPPAPAPAGVAEGSARHRAAEARRRSAQAARQAAELHLAAAKLMQASGQLRLAGRAHVRAFTALTRSRQVEFLST